MDLILYLKDSFSFHLMKNILENEENLERCKYLFEILGDMEYEGLLITHIPIDIDFQTYKYTLGYLSKVLPINNILLLENVVVNDNIGYLKKIDELFLMLDQYNLDNIKFCLDFGHLLFSFYKEGFTQYQALESLEKYKNILKNVKEIHLHDFNISFDHLHLKEGMIDLDQLSNFIEANYIRCPIILETTIKNPKEDGKQQVEIAKKLIV